VKAKILAATKPAHEGLITFEIECPLYVWTELLTHRSFARNASSNRAMSTKRTIDMGYYTPTLFLRQGKGMQASKELAKHQWLALAIWHAVTRITHAGAFLLERLGVAKEQRNRLIAPNKMIRTIMTGTESAWDYLLYLRDSDQADTAMQELAALVREEILHVEWDTGTVHKPYPHVTLIEQVTNAARVSYNRSGGKNDQELFDMLLNDKHLSPFEHLAVWKSYPYPYPTCYSAGDQEGWESFRSAIEYDGKEIAIEEWSKYMALGSHKNNDKSVGSLESFDPYPSIEKPE
jgi:thymidylate synthase ThyX